MGSQEPTFSSRDVQDAAGLSYRQINDWDKRGALPHQRSSERSWRRFTAKEIFILMVCAEMRKRFGVPLKRLQFVRDFMEQEKANHFLAAAELMVMLGVGVWILTDFEETFIMHSELEFMDLMRFGFFGGEEEKGYVFLKVNPLVNTLLEAMPDVGRIESHGRGYEILRQHDQQTPALTREEAFVLQSIREPEFSRVEVTLDSGEIKTIKTSKRRDATEQLESLLKQHDYQKLTVIRRNGQIVSIDQQATHKAQD